MHIRPMDLGDILDQTFQVFKKGYKTLLAVSVLGVIPQIFWAILTVVFVSMEQGGDVSPAVVVLMLILIIPTIVTYIAMEGALVKAINEVFMGRETRIGEAYRFGFKKVWPLLVTSVLYGLAITFGFIFLIIPGILFSIWFSLYRQVVVIEDIGYVRALTRSWNLVKGNWWRTLGITILISVLMVVLMGILAFPVGLIFGVAGTFMGGGNIDEATIQLLSSLAQIPFSILAMPFFYITITLLYFDLRIRKEGLDLEIMADSLNDSENIKLSTE